MKYILIKIDNTDMDIADIHCYKILMSVEDIVEIPENGNVLRKYELKNFTIISISGNRSIVLNSSNFLIMIDREQYDSNNIHILNLQECYKFALLQTIKNDKRCSLEIFEANDIDLTSLKLYFETI